MPAPAMLGAFNEIGVVYDCMDELAQFRNAPAEVARRERLLIANADVVFTGGYKLFQAKSALHHNVHFFGCGVDAAHFGSARLARTKIPDDARFDTPVIGYFGVIDERLDYELIQQLAAGLPHYNIVMVGPTAKINPAELPHAPNIHWVGQRPYVDLPGYVKAFDVCLMPFALNEATEFINPTKTLEYMAAGKPIVSSAVPDVITNFAPVVSIARSHSQFLDFVQRAADAPDESLIADGIELAERSSWESIVENMRQLIRAAVEEPAIISRITQETRLAPSSRTLEVPGA
jgi:glycosyltransferase involved in cell wall biosynthesis